MQPGRRPRVLYVDDNQDLADSAVELLGLVGFEARACYDGAAALLEAAEFRPEACLLDLNMPLMPGDELASRLQAQAGGRAILFVAVTAMGSAEYRLRTKAAGFHLHLVKPVDPHDLVRLVDELWRMMSANPVPAATANSHP